MNVLSVLCLFSLVPYLLIVLCLTPRKEGRKLFRTLYSAAMLGGLGTLFYAAFEQLVLDYQAYIVEGENVLRSGYAYLMLLIPVQIAAVLLNMVLKKKRPVLLLVLSAAISVAASVGVVVYVYFTDRDFSNAHLQFLQFIALYLPFLFHFSVSGLVPAEEKWQRVLHMVSLYLNLAVMIGFLGLTILLNYDIFLGLGVSGILPLLPFAIPWILVPAVPIFVYNRFRTADRIRNGEAPKHRLRIRTRQKKAEEKS